MTRHHVRRPSARASLCMGIAAAFAVAMLAACSSNKSSTEGPPPTLDGKPPSGYVDMNEVQVAYIGSARRHRHALLPGPDLYLLRRRLGVGGIGISTIDAKGEVYNLARVADFPGAYGQGRYGAVAGTASVGDLWLENPNGVVMHLKAKREGLMLSLGGDAVVVTMQQ